MAKYKVDVNENGDRDSFLDGMYHRSDGPAVEYFNGDKQWWVNGNLHREDGPAVERPSGPRYWTNNVWYLEHERLTESEYRDRVSNGQV